MAESTKSPIFITSRFRSGSTLLWNIFNQAEGYSAFYEPCHDNLLAHIKYTAPMESHREVDSYWDSYAPISEKLEQLHQYDFGITRLLLEEEDHWGDFEKYLKYLTECTGEDVAVLQCNRIDLRLPWIRSRFPDARIVHLHRNVRDAYVSIVRHLMPDQLDNANEPNIYDMLEWCAVLASDFPFLAGPDIKTMYDRHYYLWKLSRIMAERWADCSISFEEQLIKDPESGLRALVEEGGFDDEQIEDAKSLIQPVETGTWSLLHDAEWYDRTEIKCEQTLDELGLNELFGREPLRIIKQKYKSAWDRVEAEATHDLQNQMMCAYSKQRSEVTRLLNEVRSKES